VEKVRKNATRQIKEIIWNMKDCMAHTHYNNYQGEAYTPDEIIKHSVIDDIKEGCANLYKLDDNSQKGKYMLQYAGRNRWFFN
jgi:polysaccharide deacetylase 2 family uncharacterized protein YibQ